MSGDRKAEGSDRKGRAPKVDYKKLATVGREAMDSALRSSDDEVKIKRTGSKEKILEIFTDEGEGTDSADVSADGSGDGGADESARLEDELRLLEEEEKKLLEKKKVDELRRKVEEKKHSVQKLRGEVISSVSPTGSPDSSKVKKGSSAGSSGSSKSKSAGKAKLDIRDLRKDKSLKAKVKKLMLESGVDIFVSDSDSGSECGAKGESGTKKSVAKRTKKSRKVVEYSSEGSSVVSDSESEDKKSNHKKKSGILSKASDRVRFRQRYPQAYLRFEHVNSNVPFEKLDSNLFIAG